MPHVLNIQKLEHRLFDAERNQEFIVSLPELQIEAGAFIAIQGQSGCGKTTLLTILGLLRRPQVREGFTFHMTLDGMSYDIHQLWNSAAMVERLRRQYLGFSLQSGELLPALAVRENIELPLHLNARPGAERRERVASLLSGFDLLKGDAKNKLADSRINKISGGEYQRVALARAMVHRPALLFVDEPTASLNRSTALAALDQLRKLQRDEGTTIVMITHDDTLATEYADRIIRMTADGPTRGHMLDILENSPTRGA